MTKVVAAKLQEELAAETKRIKSEVKDDESLIDESQHEESLEKVERLKEDETLPNGDAVQDEDEGVDLRGDIEIMICVRRVPFMCLSCAFHVPFSEHFKSNMCLYLNISSQTCAFI